MTDQTKPASGQGTPAPAPATPAATDAATLQMLVQLLLAERQEALQDRQEKARALAAKNEQRRINAEYSVAEKNKIQQMCTHKKGGRGLKSPKTDYAVYFFTFTDASSYIRCQICGMKWRSLDTAETLVRKGQKVPNHTGIGWKQAYAMVQESTNTAAASEVQLNTQPIQTNTADLA
jgi:hypothetical protein